MDNRKRTTPDQLDRIRAWEASDPASRPQQKAIAADLGISEALMSYHVKVARRRRESGSTAVEG